jgi:hypothetical protein
MINPKGLAPKSQAFLILAILGLIFLALTLALKAQAALALGDFGDPGMETGALETKAIETEARETEAMETGAIETPREAPAAFDRPPAIKGVTIPEKAGAKEILAAFMGLPFRIDGTVNDDGAFATWGDQAKTFRSPGLNCSGFTAAAGRFLFGRNFRLDDLRRDRQSDSGPDSPLGKDWDFGLDVALNLAEGYFLRYLPEPVAPTFSLNAANRPVGWGLNLHSSEFSDLLKEFEPDRLYVFVVSKPDRRFKGGLSYYHLGLALADREGGVWLYHATARAGVHRINLAGGGGLLTLRRYFPPVKGGGERRILFIELALPGFWPNSP